jgi:hypothetical protein
VLFFIDETWQELGGQQVGALGAVALPQAGYNRLCREVFATKQKILDAKELSDAELKGAKCFANRRRGQFKRRTHRGVNSRAAGASRFERK